MTERIEWALHERDASLMALDGGDADEARARAQEALRALEAPGLGLEAERASVVLVLAEIEETAGNLEGAGRFLRQAVGLLPAPQVGCDLDVVRLWCRAQTRLGDWQRSGGEFAGAEDRLLAVVTQAKAAFGEADEAVVNALIALGVVYKYAGRYADSEATYLQALRVVEADQSPDRATLAVLFHNLGGLEHARGRPRAGIVWAEGGLALQESALGAGHPDVARDLNALGALYQLDGRLPDAADAYRRALAIFEARYGPHHYEVGMTLANLAALRTDECRDREAVALGRRALRILERVLGPDHAEVGLTLHNLGVALAHCGDLADATDVLHQALAILAATLPADHPQLPATREALTRCQEVSRS